MKASHYTYNNSVDLEFSASQEDRYKLLCICGELKKDAAEALADDDIDKALKSIRNINQIQEAICSQDEALKRKEEEEESDG